MQDDVIGHHHVKQLLLTQFQRKVNDTHRENQSMYCKVSNASDLFPDCLHNQLSFVNSTATY